jgi:hypothetical protein
MDWLVAVKRQLGGQEPPEEVAMQQPGAADDEVRRGHPGSLERMPPALRLLTLETEPGLVL